VLLAIDRGNSEPLLDFAVELELIARQMVSARER